MGSTSIMVDLIALSLPNLWNCLHRNITKYHHLKANKLTPIATITGLYLIATSNIFTETWKLKTKKRKMSNKYLASWIHSTWENGIKRIVAQKVSATQKCSAMYNGDQILKYSLQILSSNILFYHQYKFTLVMACPFAWVYTYVLM